MRPNSVTGSKNNQISMSLEPEVWGKPPPRKVYSLTLCCRNVPQVSTSSVHAYQPLQWNSVQSGDLVIQGQAPPYPVSLQQAFWWSVGNSKAAQMGEYTLPLNTIEVVFSLKPKFQIIWFLLLGSVIQLACLEVERGYYSWLCKISGVQITNPKHNYKPRQVKMYISISAVSLATCPIFCFKVNRYLEQTQTTSITVVKLEL